ncbi:uncharacterized protein LOC120163227 [Hibiscus syriacus]|uniref:uncharacterized protein LOC120163227 n=1 Tax=Hibiscus syriacus TaxID=106335 RepID=UPI0019245989|nr:uncharacterized protein LOC120163227 [Hibiscus syriacus]
MSLGNFNATLFPQDRNGSAPSSSTDSDVNGMVYEYDCSLQDLGFHGPNFTWFRGTCSVLLDRCLGNSACFESYLLSSLEYLTRMKSDHRPILLSSHPTSLRRTYPPFRYFFGWNLHGDFKRLVTDNWDSSLPIMDLPLSLLRLSLGIVMFRVHWQE